MSFGFSELAAIRLGFGLSPLMPPAPDVDALLAGVAHAGPLPDAMTTETARAMTLELRDTRRAREEDKSEANEEAFQIVNTRMGMVPIYDLRDRIARAVDDGVGFGERLVQFWADHFTVISAGSATHPLAVAFVDEAIRPHIGGRFEDMFFAADTHPMMLTYLNQSQSKGPNSPFVKNRPKMELGLNENLAREAMELHSLGVDAGYSQDDVRQLAELLTGMEYTANLGFRYRADVAEPGAETVLGKSYGGNRRGGMEDIRTALTDIARRPETARYLSRKLAVHFVADDPGEDLVNELAGVWQETQGDLPSVYRVLATHPDLVTNLRKKVRQPFEMVVAALRALGVNGGRLADLDDKQLRRFFWGPMIAMGQPWGKPTGPDGWPEEAESWIAPQMLAARINWTMNMPRGLLPRQLPDPREMLISTFGGTQSAQLSWAVPKAESAAEGVALILASNDFNRR